MVQKVFFNALEKPENREMPDLSKREIVILAPMLALMIWIGVQPSPILRRMEPSVQVVLEQVNGNDLQAQTKEAQEVQITLSSTTALDEGEDAETPAPTHPGDEE
jgi:hypothetical protein